MKMMFVFVVISLFILLPAFTLAAEEESDVIWQAQKDARVDGEHYSAFLWGLGGFFFSYWATSAMSLLCSQFTMGPDLSMNYWIDQDLALPLIVATPILTGGCLALTGYFTGMAKLPESRVTLMRELYEVANFQKLYESEYTKTLIQIQRRKRGNAALVGFGLYAGSAIVLGIAVAVMWAGW